MLENGDLDLVDEVMGEDGVWSHKRQAWYRIKKFVEEAQKTPANNGSTCASQIAADIESWITDPVGKVIRMQPCVLRKWAQQLRTCR